MSYIVKKKAKSNCIIAYLLGFLSATDIVYLFFIGDTPILLIWVYAFVFVLLFFLTSPKNVFNKIRYISNSLKMEFAFILLSIVSIMFRNEDAFHAWEAGIIKLLLNICILILVLILENYTLELIKGITAGIIASIILSLYAFWQFKLGNVFTLKEYFPQITDIVVLKVGSSFRPSGFFKESGHLMRYINLFFLIIMGKKHCDEKSSLRKYLFVIPILIIEALSLSSAVVFYIFGIVVTILNYMRIKKTVKKNYFILAFVGILIITVGFAAGISIFASLSAGVTDLFNTNDVGNLVRIQGMLGAIEIIKEYWITGCGWNGFPTVFKKMGFVTKYVFGSYSSALTLIAELGLFSLFYFYFLISKINTLFFKASNLYDICLGSSLIVYLLEFGTTNYDFDPAVAILVGLVLLRIRGKSLFQEELS